MRLHRIVRFAAAAALVALAACNQQKPADGDGPGGSDGGTRPAMTEEDLRQQAQKLLAGLGAPAAPAARLPYEGAFEAVGAEPDWKMTLLNDFVTFSRPGLEEVSGVPSARDIREKGAYVMAGPLTIAVQAGACTYVEGGESYPYTATVLFEGVAYEGCARPGAGAAGQSSGWAVALPHLLPAIDACLTRVQARPGRVTYAYVNEEGQTAVRIAEADGGRSECLVAPDGATVARVDPLSDRDVFRDERDPLFTRAPAKPPASSCTTSEEVKGSNGATVGWLSRKTC